MRKDSILITAPTRRPLIGTLPMMPATVLQVLLAWQCERLTEGQAAQALGIHRLALRELRDEQIAEGVAAHAVSKARAGDANSEGETP
jgi:hypothetical protein